MNSASWSGCRRPLQSFPRSGDHLANEPQSEVLADNRHSLEQFLLLGRQPVDARGQNRLYRSGDLEGVERSGNPDRAVAHQDAFLDEHLIDLLHEERVALGFLLYQSLEWRDTFVVSQQRTQHLVRTLFAQRIEVVELGLGFVVDLVQVLENHHYRLIETLAQENALDRILGAAAANLPIHPRKRIVALDQPQQSEQVGAGILERGIECHDSAIDLLAASALVILRGDPKIAVQQFD